MHEIRPKISNQLSMYNQGEDGTHVSVTETPVLYLAEGKVRTRRSLVIVETLSISERDATPAEIAWGNKEAAKETTKGVEW